jgi:hypothetical protein
MIKKGLLLGFVIVFTVLSQAQEIKVITIIESIVPMGLGRSRMIEEKADMDYKILTSERTDGKKSNSGNTKRSDAKVDKFAETKLLNFYSGVGINFQNIASNDAVISSKINEMISQGWTLTFVTSAVESDSGKGDGAGIFITRLFFSKK